VWVFDGELGGFGASLDLACRCLNASHQHAHDIVARDPPLQGVLVVGEDGQPVVAVEHELAQCVLEVLVAEEGPCLPSSRRRLVILRRCPS
jgi:hypothetical protein